MYEKSGVRCWFAPHDMRMGAKILDTLDEAIRLLEKARALVGGVGVDGATQMVRIVGDEPERPAFDSYKCGHQADAELAAQLQHRPRVGQNLDHWMNLVRTPPPLG